MHARVRGHGCDAPLSLIGARSRVQLSALTRVGPLAHACAVWRPPVCPPLSPEWGPVTCTNGRPLAAQVGTESYWELLEHTGSTELPSVSPSVPGCSGAQRGPWGRGGRWGHPRDSGGSRGGGHGVTPAGIAWNGTFGDRGGRCSRTDGDSPGDTTVSRKVHRGPEGRQHLREWPRPRQVTVSPVREHGGHGPT